MAGPTSSRTATNITRQQIEDLGKASRGFNALLNMAPGVRPEVKSGSSGVGGVQVDGASGSENAYYIDGVEVSDLRRGSLNSANAIPFEFVQEIAVKSGGFEAEFGGATGGVINVATRSGIGVPLRDGPATAGADRQDRTISSGDWMVGRVRDRAF